MPGNRLKQQAFGVGLAKRTGQRGLRVHVDQVRSNSGAAEQYTERRSGRRFGGAALLVGDRDDIHNDWITIMPEFCHGQIFQLSGILAKTYGWHSGIAGILAFPTSGLAFPSRAASTAYPLSGNETGD